MKYFELISISIILCFAAIAVWFIKRKVTIHTARTKGIDKVSQYIANPILAIDYAEQSGEALDVIQSRVTAGKMKGYIWGGYLFVENKSA